MGAWLLGQHDFGDIVITRRREGDSFRWRGGAWLIVDTRWDLLPGIPRQLAVGDVFAIGQYRLRVIGQHPMYKTSWICKRERWWERVFAWAKEAWRRWA